MLVCMHLFPHAADCFVVAAVVLCLTVRSLSCRDAWNGRTALPVKGNLESHHHREGAERLYLPLAFVG